VSPPAATTQEGNMPQCNHCGQNKSTDDFFKLEDRNGFYRWCKQCMSENGREKDWPTMRNWGSGSLSVEVETLDAP